MMITRAGSTSALLRSDSVGAAGFRTAGLDRQDSMAAKCIQVRRDGSPTHALPQPSAAVTVVGIAARAGQRLDVLAALLPVQAILGPQPPIARRRGMSESCLLDVVRGAKLLSCAIPASRGVLPMRAGLSRPANGGVQGAEPASNHCRDCPKG